MNKRIKNKHQKLEDKYDGELAMKRLAENNVRHSWEEVKIKNNL
jgi:hypothetical protein